MTGAEAAKFTAFWGPFLGQEVQQQEVACPACGDIAMYFPAPTKEDARKYLDSCGLCGWEPGRDIVSQTVLL